MLGEGIQIRLDQEKSYSKKSNSKCVICGQWTVWSLFDAKTTGILVLISTQILCSHYISHFFISHIFPYFQLTSIIWLSSDNLNVNIFYAFWYGKGPICGWHWACNEMCKTMTLTITTTIIIIRPKLHFGLYILELQSIWSLHFGSS